MTEKVKVTREQAEAIEKSLTIFGEKPTAVEHHLCYGWENHECVALNSVEDDDYIRALYIGYEVEPEFKKGDFVVWHGLVVNIKHPQTNDHKDDGRCYFTLERSDGSTYGNITRDKIRHATPSEIAEEKERRWWKKHWRKPWELRTGDILTRNDDGFLWMVDGGEGFKGYYLNGEFLRLDYIKGRYQVACFAENRLDVETNE